MNQRTVIVTGGAGYVGAHACKALAEAGYTPVVLDDLSVGHRWAVRWGPLEQVDVTDAAEVDRAFRRHAPVGVLHFAALTLVGESVREPLRYYRSILGGAQTMIEVCRAQGVRAFVFSSTCAVYGAPERVPIMEEAPKAPINPYGAAKLTVERILADCDAADGFPHICLRYFNAAGADPDGEIGERRLIETHLLPLVLDAILHEGPPVRVFGDDYPTPDGTAVRDYVHVADLARAHLRALEHLLGGGPSCAINLGSGRGFSVREVIETAARVSGRPVPNVLAPRRVGDPPELVADPRNALRLFGGDLMRRSDLETIIADAWAWRTSPAYARAVRSERAAPPPVAIADGPV